MVGWEASAFRPASTVTLLTTPLGATPGPEPDQPVLPRAPACSFCAHRCAGTRGGRVCVDGHGESQRAAVEGAEGLHRGVLGPHGDPVLSRPWHGHSDTAAETQRWRGLSEQPAHLTERETEAVEVPQPLKVSPGCRAGPGSREPDRELGAQPEPLRPGPPACPLLLSVWVQVWSRSGVGMVHVLERGGRHWTPTPCPSRKPPPRSPLRALGFGAIREPERVTSLNGADGVVAGFPSPCPAPAGGPGLPCPPPGPAGAWCQPLSPGQPVSAAGAVCICNRKGPSHPGQVSAPGKGPSRNPSPPPPIRSQAGRPQRGHPGPQPLPGRSVPDPGGGQPRGGLQPLPGLGGGWERRWERRAW